MKSTGINHASSLARSLKTLKLEINPDGFNGGRLH